MHDHPPGLTIDAVPPDPLERRSLTVLREVRSAA